MEWQKSGSALFVVVNCSRADGNQKISAWPTTSKKAASVVVGSSWRRLSLFYFPRGRRTFLRNTQEHHRMTGSFPNPSGRLQPQVLFCVVWRN